VNKVLFYRFNLLLVCLQSGYSLVSLLSIPRDPKNILFFGLSYERLLMISFPLIIMAIAGYIFVKTWWDIDWIKQIDYKIRSQLARDHRLGQAVLICIVFVVLGSIFSSAVSFGSFYILAPPEHGLFSYMVYYVDQIYLLISPFLIRLRPLIIFVTGICVQTIIILFAVMIKPGLLVNRFKTHNIYMIFGLYGVLLVLWKILGWTHLKLSPDFSSSGWLTLGTPILETQVFLAFSIGCAIFGIGFLIYKFSSRMRHTDTKGRFAKAIDLIIILIIWLTAAVYWLSFPTQDSKFLNKPQYPNYAYYPNSDALTYDTTAQNLLVGVGFKTRDLEYPRRPVYAWFLALMYSVFGQNYEVVTMLQSALLGVFPVLVYLLAIRLYNRLSGLIAAILIILREGNAIYLGNYITDSNSRMIMSEIPTAVGMALLVLLVSLWMRQPHKREIYSLLIGGTAAFFMLIRIEVGIFLLIFVFFIGVLLVRRPKVWLANVVMVTLGVVLFLAPWVWRNWRVTGRIYIEQPNERISYILARTGFSGGSISLTDATTQKPQTDGEEIRTFFQRSLSHFFNSQAQAFLIFPDAYRTIDSTVGFFGHKSLKGFFKVCCSRQDYISRLYPLWHEWNGNLPYQSILPIMVTLFIVSVGLINSWKKAGGFGVFPVLLVVAQYMTSSVVRVSGGRFVQIVDWIWVVYYSIGMGQLVVWTFAYLVSSKFPNLLGDTEEPDMIIAFRSTPQQSPWGIYGKISLVILLIGVIFPLTEYVIKPRYTLETKQVWLREITQSRTLMSDYPEIIKQIEDISPNDPRVLQGRALYPRYYPAGEGDLDYESWNAPRDYDRFSFYLVGPVNTGVVVPLGEKPALSFPQAADILVIGCQDEGFLNGLLVYVKSTDNILLSSPLPDSISCSERVIIDTK